MIEYLLLLLLAKYRHGFVTAGEPDDMDWHLAPGAGIDYEPPQAANDRVIEMERV